jgi:hypothetical protein
VEAERGIEGGNARRTVAAAVQRTVVAAWRANTKIFGFLLRQHEERGAQPRGVTDSLIFGGADIFDG